MFQKLKTLIVIIVIVRCFMYDPPKNHPPKKPRTIFMNYNNFRPDLFSCIAVHGRRRLLYPLKRSFERLQVLVLHVDIFLKVLLCLAVLIGDVEESFVLFVPHLL